jgi:hypothetical protein
MLSMPFADETSSSLATKTRAAEESEDEDGDATAAGSSESTYSFEGYQIESSERIMLTPMGIPAATPRKRS